MSILLTVVPQVLASICITGGLWLLGLVLCNYYYFGGYNNGKIEAEWGSYGWSFARIYLYLDGMLLGEGVSFCRPTYSYIKTCSKSQLNSIYRQEEESLRQYIAERLEMSFDEYVRSLKRKRIKILLAGLVMVSLGSYILYIVP